ncbi:MAG: NAD-dependent epimerase/dehydratase family protein [Phycisphaerales bacterium]|nr:MAG: NAD-dependent epimerase/dehydratase family protein [Phycisphaerales bacterium]
MTTPTPASPARRPVTLITGAQGEFGHALVHALSEHSDTPIVAIDKDPIDPALARRCAESHALDLTDGAALDALLDRLHVGTAYHLAALLSRSAEERPDLAHAVNVEATVHLLRRFAAASHERAEPVRMLFPSSIAVYGLPTRAAKDDAQPLREEEHTTPITIYGCHKLACEHIGRYYATRLGASWKEPPAARVDFRAIRFPGVISAETEPRGGTSDFAPQALHRTARGEAYESFVDEHARLPFMTMPDAVRALLELGAAPDDALTRRVYNVGAFSLSAAEVASRASAHFNGVRITYNPDPARMAIVNSWPADVNTDAARADWGYTPEHTLSRAFEDYLVPGLRTHH